MYIIARSGPEISIVVLQALALEGKFLVSKAPAVMAAIRSGR